MLALQSYEQASGFSVMAAGIVCMAGGMIQAATAPATAGISAIGAAGAFCTGATLFAYGLGAVTGSYNGSYGATVVDACSPTITSLVN